jgi:hypothetical protein
MQLLTPKSDPQAMRFLAEARSLNGGEMCLRTPSLPLRPASLSEFFKLEMPKLKSKRQPTPIHITPQQQVHGAASFSRREFQMMPYSNTNKLAEIKKIAAEQEVQPGFSSMAGTMKREKKVTYNEGMDVISHGTFFHPADLDPFTYPHMALGEIDVVRNRSFHINCSMLLNCDESTALNENLDWMVVAQVDCIVLMSRELPRTVDCANRKTAKREALSDLYNMAANNVLTLRRDGYECIKLGPFEYEVRKRVFQGH